MVQSQIKMRVKLQQMHFNDHWSNSHSQLVSFKSHVHFSQGERKIKAFKSNNLRIVIYEKNVDY